jgi:hypothetical protein
MGENWGTLFDTRSGHRVSFLDRRHKGPAPKDSPMGSKSPAGAAQFETVKRGVPTASTSAGTVPSWSGKPERWR